MLPERADNSKCTTDDEPDHNRTVPHNYYSKALSAILNAWNNWITHSGVYRFGETRGQECGADKARIVLWAYLVVEPTTSESCRVQVKTPSYQNGHREKVKTATTHSWHNPGTTTVTKVKWKTIVRQHLKIISEYIVKKGEILHIHCTDCKCILSTTTYKRIKEQWFSI